MCWKEAFGATVEIKGNSNISGGTSGVVVQGSTGSANIHDNNASIHGNTVGIDVTGGNATITNNHIYDNGTGIRLKTTGAATVTSNNFVGPNDNGTDIRLDADAGALTLGNGNAFAGNSFYIDNRSPQNFDLTTNTSTLEGFNRNVLADAFRIEDHLFHKPDASASGLIRVVANNIYVTAPGTGASDESINRGVIAASAGDTINVENGTYHEYVDVTNTKTGITILGQSEAGAILDGTGQSAIIDTGALNIQATGVTVRKLTVKGSNTNPARYGVKAYQAHGLVLDQVTAKNNFRTGIDINGSNNVTLSNITSMNNGGAGIAFTDGNNADISNITTSGNPWSSITVATFGRFAPLGVSGVVIHGTNSFGEVTTDNGGLQLEAGNFNNPSSPTAITWSNILSDGANVTIQSSDFAYALGGPQALDDGPNHYIRTKFYDTLAHAKSAAEGSPDHYLPNDRFIRTVNGFTQTTNYYVYDTVVGDKMSIQAAINDSKNGDIINVAAGTFHEDVTVNKTLTVTGAGPASTTVSGPIGGDNTTFFLTANNIELNNFKITRDGNNTTDWNGALNTAGVAMAQGTTGVNVHDNLITGNRTGIDINNSGGHNVHNNRIVDNRTGMIFRNQTDNMIVTENDIADNWTVGVLFLDASGGSNSPVQTALNGNFTNNNLSGNWYGQIVDRQSGGSLPAPGTTNLKNFSGNWYGTNAPVISSANSAEPGYAAQIPVAFGGTATAPGGQPDVLGPAVANFDITPYLDTGTDTNPGSYGFQGSFATLHVVSDLAQTQAGGRINEGVARVNDPGTLKVHTGSYTENASTAGKAINFAPGTSPGQVTINGNLTFDSNDTYVVELAGTAANQYDSVHVTGTVDLGSAALTVSRSFAPFPGNSFMIVEKISAGATVGTFAGKPEGSTFTVAGIPLTITYQGGDGNDTVLSVANPNTVWVNDTWVEASNTSGGTPGVVEPGDIVDSNPGAGDTSVTGKTFGYDAFATIQNGVNAVAASGTVNIIEGAYSESNILVPRAQTIHGFSRSNVVLSPAGVDGHVNDNFTSANNAFLIGASNVSIDHLTIDGGAGKNFRNAVLTNYTVSDYGNIDIDNVTVSNIFRKGVAFYVTSNNKVTGDSITNSSFDHIGGAGVTFEATFAIAAFQSDTDITNVQITTSAGGIGTNYFTTDANSPLVHISNTTVSNMSGLTGIPVIGMDLSGLADGSSVTGGSVDVSGAGSAQADRGIVVQYTATNADVSVTGVTLTTGGGANSDTGIMIYQAQQAAHPVQITNNILVGNGAAIGIDVTDDGSFFGETPHVGVTYAIVRGNTISGFDNGAGVAVEANGGTASATVGTAGGGNGNTITGNSDGVDVIGGTATITNNNIHVGSVGVSLQGFASSSATISSNTLDSQVDGISVQTGHATISGNTIKNTDSPGFGTGIQILSGAAASVDNNILGVGGLLDTDLEIATGGTIDGGTITGNTFRATTFFINQMAAQNINALIASGNDYGTTDNFAIENKVYHKVDNAASGLVTWVANNIYVTPTASPSATDNDYTRIANGVAGMAAGFTLNLQGTFNWTETNAAASWAKGNDANAGTTDDNYTLTIPGGLNGATFTAPGGLGSATIHGPGDVPTENLEGVFVFLGSVAHNQNTTISNLVIEQFDLPIAFFDVGVGGQHQFDGSVITNNHLIVAQDLSNADAPADVNQNIGIHFSFGQNQTISNNIIDLSAAAANNAGLTASNVGMQSNTSGGDAYDGLAITGNTINIVGPQSADAPNNRGIWENGHAHNSDISVSNNQVILSGTNNPVTNHTVGFRLTSHSSGSTTVTYSGNSVSGANIGYQWIAGSDFSGQQPIVFANNSATDSNTAILVQSNGKATITGATLTNTGAMAGVGTGISILAGSSVTLDGSPDENVISGFATGISNAGTLVVVDNDASIHDNATGILSSGGSATISNSHLYNSSVLIDITGGTASITNNNLGAATVAQVRTSVNGNTITGNTFTDPMPTAGKRFAGPAGGTYNIPALYAANTWDTAVSVRDAANPGTANYQQALWANIQGGVNAANPNDYLHAYKGAYTENGAVITVNKTMTLEGANNASDARTRAVGDANEAWIKTGVSVGADGVALDGFLIDNDGAVFPTLGGAAVYLPGTSSGYQFLNNIVRDNVFGLYLNSSGTTNTLVQHNSFDSNNRPGPAGGNAIYADQGSHNITVNENKFTGHTSAAAVFAGAAGLQSDLTVTNNQMVNDNSVVMYNTATANISGNTWTNAQGTGVYLGGNDSNITVNGNTYNNGVSRLVIAFNDGTYPGNCSNITVTNNIVNTNLANLIGNRNQIDLRNVGGLVDVSGNSVTLSGAGAFTATAISVTDPTATSVTLANNILNGGGTAGTTGVIVTNAALLNYTNNTLINFATGGTFTNVTRVNYTTSGANDTYTLTAATMKDNANQAINYTGVSTLVVSTLAGDDLITVLGAGAGLTTWVDAGADTDEVDWESGAGNDSVVFSTAPINTGPTSTESVYFADNTQTVNMKNAETRRIRTNDGHDQVNYVRFVDSVATGFVIETGIGNDSVIAGLGNDSIFGGDGADRLDGKEGNDDISGEIGNDICYGGVGNDILRGGAGTNQLYGQNGNDTIFAQNGVLDFVDGGAGFDSAQVDGIDLISSIENFLP